jgi:hypothetical protein
VEWQFVLRPQLISKLYAVRTQLDVSQMRAHFLGSEVREAVLTHVNEFSPKHFKSRFIKDFVTAILKPYNAHFRTLSRVVF